VFCRRILPKFWYQLEGDLSRVSFALLLRYCRAVNPRANACLQVRNEAISRELNEMGRSEMYSSLAGLKYTRSHSLFASVNTSYKLNKKARL
jgi:hypothetical protein